MILTGTRFYRFRGQDRLDFSIFAFLNANEIVE